MVVVLLSLTVCRSKHGACSIRLIGFIKSVCPLVFVLCLGIGRCIVLCVGCCVGNTDVSSVCGSVGCAGVVNCS